jgi:hypothetical protein
MRKPGLNDTQGESPPELARYTLFISLQLSGSIKEVSTQKDVSFSQTTSAFLLNLATYNSWA